MICPDVNVLIYAHRREAPEHAEYVEWLTAVATGPEPFAISELVATAFVRIVTNPRAFEQPTELTVALRFIEQLRQRPNCHWLRAGPRTWDIFCQFCRDTSAKSKLVADAYHAAIATEHACEWLTADADFGRFPKLRWRHPLRSR